MQSTSNLDLQRGTTREFPAHARQCIGESDWSLDRPSAELGYAVRVETHEAPLSRSKVNQTRGPANSTRDGEACAHRPRRRTIRTHWTFRSRKSESNHKHS